MKGLFNKLLGKSDTPPKQITVILKFEGEEDQPSDTGEDSQGASGVQTGETLDAIHEEFCRTFCHKPGVNFMEFVRAEKITKLIDWLHWKTPEAETMAFLTLAVDATRRGIPFWEQQDIHGFREGGRPSKNSADALSVIAQIIGIRIRLFYRDNASDKMMVWDFEP